MRSYATVPHRDENRELEMRVGCPKEIKNHEYRVGLTPGFGARICCERPHRDRRNARRAKASAPTTTPMWRPARRSLPTAEGSFRAVRHDRKGQGAAAVRMGDAARGPDPLHLSASRARSGTDQGSCRKRLHRCRLRDGHRRARRPAAACADVGSRRTAGHPGVATALQKANGGHGVLLGGVPGVLPGEGRRFSAAASSDSTPSRWLSASART